jgi:hypothetical protein
MPGEVVDLRAQTIPAACERSDDGEKERRPSAPDGRIAAPQKIAPAAIAQRRQLRSEGIDLGGKIAGTQGHPQVLLV